MICPICGEEMKQGVMELYIRNLPAIWYPSDVNKEKNFFKRLVSRMKCDDSKVCMPDKEDDPTAWYCPSCKKIWMSFDEVIDE
jgi:hypothetical protein